MYVCILPPASMEDKFHNFSFSGLPTGELV